MRYAHLWRAGLFGFLVLNACATDSGDTKAQSSPVAQPTDSAPMDPAAASSVKFEQPLRFTGPGDSDLLVPAGEYQVKAGEGTQLKLTAKDQPQPIVIEAVSLSHDELSKVPMARLFAAEPDQQQIALLLPGGTGLVASGSKSGVGGRGVSSAILSFKRTEAPAPIQQIYNPPGGWIKASGGGIPQEALPMGRNRFGSVYLCRGSLPAWPGSIWVGSLWPGSGGCLTKNGTIANYEVLAPFWAYAKNGTIPSGAIGAGSAAGGGATFYVCRAYYGGGWLAGRVYSGFNGCQIAWKGASVTVPGYDVLLKSFVTMTGGGADQTLSPETIQRAMPLGKSTPDGQTGAPCTTQYNGYQAPGRLSWADRGCVIAWGAGQVTRGNFSTFIALWRGGIDDRSLVAGKVANDPKPQLYSCRYLTKGSNETVVGYISNNFGTCEFVYPDGSANGREKSNDILADFYKDLVPNWDPAVK